MKFLVPALLLVTALPLVAQDAPAGDLQAQRQALNKEIGAIRDEYIKNTPDLAAQKAAIDDQRKALWKKADEGLKGDAKYQELRTKLRAVQDEIKKSEAK